ncbi:RNA-directed DNA polymerase [Vibrio campbellii]
MLKALAIALNQTLPKSRLCYSWKGHGGVARALKGIHNTHQVHYFVKTDVTNYYASLSHYQLLEQLTPHVTSSAVMRLLYVALTHQQPNIGIPRGSPLSHVLGNFYLHHLDLRFENRSTQHYFRYMDDVLVLSDKKGALRRSISTIKQAFSDNGLAWATPKSFIGSIDKHQIVFLGEELFGKARF